MNDRFSLSSRSKEVVEIGHFHAVRFYKDADSLCGIVAEFLEEGFRQAQPAVVIATPEHLDGIVQRLHTHRSPNRSHKHSLFVLDAQKTLDRFMVDGEPDAHLFTKAVTPILTKATGGRRNKVVRAYGEMVDVLWQAGQSHAAIRLEILWNELALHHSFSLLCGYSMGNFYKDAAVEEICGQHTHFLAPRLEEAILG